MDEHMHVNQQQWLTCQFILLVLRAENTDVKSNAELTSDPLREGEHCGVQLKSAGSTWVLALLQLS